MNKKIPIKTFSVLFAIWVVLAFDLVEITVGSFLESINESRPQKGTLWETAQKKFAAAGELGILLAESSSMGTDFPEIETFNDLNRLLEEARLKLL